MFVSFHPQIGRDFDMKKIITLFLLLSVFCARAQNFANVLYNVTNSSSASTITLTPLNNGGVAGIWLVPALAKTLALSTNPVVFSNVLMGQSYQVKIQDLYYRTTSTWTNTFASGLSGTINGALYTFANTVIGSVGVVNIYPGNNVSFVTNADGSVTVNSSGGGGGQATNVPSLSSTNGTITITQITNNGTIGTNDIQVTPGIILNNNISGNAATATIANSAATATTASTAVTISGSTTLSHISDAGTLAALNAITSNNVSGKINPGQMFPPVIASQAYLTGAQSNVLSANGIQIGAFDNNNNFSVGRFTVLAPNGSSSENFSFGNSALVGPLFSGSWNVAFGGGAGSAMTNGDQNTILGGFAGSQWLKGYQNIAIGYDSLGNNINSTNNIAIGANAGSALSGQEANDIYIGSAGATGESGAIRIGTPGIQNQAYISGQLNANGPGVSNLNASIIGPATMTNWPFYSVPQFSGVGDATFNDTAAVSNMFTAYNAGGPPVMDLLGRTYYVTSGFAITRPHGTLQNGGFIVPSNFVGSVLIHSSDQPSVSKSGFVFQFLNIGRQGTNPPDPSVIGIQTGTQNQSYANDVTVRYCLITNMARSVEIVDTPQSDIEHNGGYYWSNGVYVASSVSSGAGGEGGDESIIALNDLNNADFMPSIPTMIKGIRENATAVQLDGLCIDLKFELNNVGSIKQEFVSSPLINGAQYHIVGNECEGLFSANSNMCPIEIWNATVDIHGSGFFAGIGTNNFGSSNYIAQVGLYATNGSHLNPMRDNIVCQGGLIMDIWTAEGMVPFGGQLFPEIACPNGATFYVHTNFHDTTPVTFVTSAGTKPYGFSNGTNVYYGNPVGGTITFGNQNAMVYQPSGQYMIFQNGPDFTGGVPTFGSFSMLNMLGRGGNPLTIGTTFSQPVKIYSTASSTPDEIFLTGTNTAPCVNLLTNAGNQLVGSHIGNGAGLTNIPGSAINYPTNWIPANGVINFAVPYQECNSNANFTWALPSGFVPTAANATVIYLTNRLGSLITDSPNPSWTAQGTWNCTNVSMISLFAVAGFTNAISSPIK